MSLSTMGQDIADFNEEDLPYGDLNNAKNLFSGGMNSPLVNRIDLDRDGIDDVLFFEKTSGKLMPYINMGNDYKYAPEYRSAFPEGLRNWVVSYDFNGDGRKDLFTKSPFGISVYLNTSAEELSFELYTEVLFTIGTTGNINLQVNSTDIPALVDYDNDGDMDLFTFHFAGTGTIEYHRNMAVENYSRTDTLAMMRETRTWGNIQDCGCGELIPLDQECNTNGRELHAGGKSLLIADIDNDGVKDMLYGDEFCQSIAYLKNFGSEEQPVFSNSEYPWPMEPAEGFQAAYLWNKGLSDSLVLVPNVFTNEGFKYDFSKSVRLYKNIEGTYILVNDEFIQEQSLDYGEKTYWTILSELNEPFEALVSYMDLNMDGVVKRVYESDGVFIDEEIYRFTAPQLDIRSFVTQVSDMDNDGKTDVFFGYRLIDNSNVINYARDVRGAQETKLIEGLSFFTSESLHFFDWDTDGLPEVWKTSTSGKVSLYEGVETSEGYQYSISEEEFKGMGLDALKGQRVFSFAQWDNSLGLDLLLADRNGNFSFYSNVTSDASESRELTGLVKGIYSISSTGIEKPILAIGTKEGGLVFKNIDLSFLENGPVNGQTLSIYPVPTDKSLNVKFTENHTIEIFDLSGKLIYEDNSFKKDRVLNFSQFSSSGIFFIRAVTEAGRVMTGKMIKLK
ncbi:T9SS type A sorting domain-containing protein [Mangrovivirga sp. M17]|uniref:T9SS type A sorting domain-containing protein n=1 Tax=Mangrovivirga halotolerans TaxID=2993936 RepID=A0ABT3RX23_9BACT|nr:T9SS type A sorting domain-containing protein [Mangrovivirga halotolerans]MCX2745914.1 T9SS type A sorting domain-containing protein [Mangrovivirga halotolerans]